MARLGTGTRRSSEKGTPLPWVSSTRRAQSSTSRGIPPWNGSRGIVWSPPRGPRATWARGAPPRRRRAPPRGRTDPGLTNGGGGGRPPRAPRGRARMKLCLDVPGTRPGGLSPSRARARGIQFKLNYINRYAYMSFSIPRTRGGPADPWTSGGLPKHFISRAPVRPLDWDGSNGRATVLQRERADEPRGPEPHAEGAHGDRGPG